MSEATLAAMVTQLGTEITVEHPAEEMEEPHYYLGHMFFYETDLAERLKMQALVSVADRSYLQQDALQSAFHKQVGYYLTDEQLSAVYTIVERNLSVLTGGPGVGKTTVLRAIVALAKAENYRIALAAPTGKAARRMTDATGHEARTMHRLLGFDMQEGKFIHGPDNPLPYSFVILDEASMIDLSLARAFFAAIDPHQTQVLLVGDKDQLPAVGPGSILNSIIQSGVAPVCELTKIMRQAEKSGIVVDAHRINRGEMPTLDWEDCTFLEAAEPEQMQAYVVSLAKAAAGKREFQVLSPMRKGPVGCKALNKLLQSALNPQYPGRPELVFGKDDWQRIYRLGDRVIQCVNDYDRQVFNGDVGEIVDIDVREKLVSVRFADVDAVYGAKDLDEVDLAYALTIHKCQGSEYAETAIMLHSGQHHIMCQRRLAYTAITRAREKVTIIGDSGAMSKCVRNTTSAKRYSALLERLTG